MLETKLIEEKHALKLKIKILMEEMNSREEKYDNLRGDHDRLLETYQVVSSFLKDDYEIEHLTRDELWAKILYGNKYCRYITIIDRADMNTFYKQLDMNTFCQQLDGNKIEQGDDTFISPYWLGFFTPIALAIVGLVIF